MTSTPKSFISVVIIAASLCCLPLGKSLAGPDVPTGLIEQKEEKIVVGSAEDFALAGTYQAFQDKGPVAAGQRITIMTKKTRYKVGEPIRVFHVREAVESWVRLYIGSDGYIYDEYVDGKLVTIKRPPMFAWGGQVQEGSVVDLNGGVTSYTFDRAGSHTIQWRDRGPSVEQGAGPESNIIKVEVVKE